MRPAASGAALVGPAAPSTPPCGSGENSTTGRVLRDRRAVLEADRRHVDVQVPGEDRLVLQPRQRLAARPQPRRAAELADHPGQLADLLGPGALLGDRGPCARRAHRESAGGTRLIDDRGHDARSRRARAALDSRGGSRQQPPDADRGDHDHHGAPRGTCSAAPPASRAARTRSRRSPTAPRRRPAPASSGRVAAPRARPTAAPAAPGRSRAGPTKRLMMPVTLLPWIARPEPSALLPAWKKLSRRQAGDPEPQHQHHHGARHRPATASTAPAARPRSHRRR